MELIYRYDPFQPVARQTPADAAAAIDVLCAGNGRFAEFVSQMQQRTIGEHVQSPIVIPVSPLSLGLPIWPGGELDQAPFALVLGCADARVPVELIFDQAFNDLFVIRVAGNVLGVECLGSIDYAVRHLSGSLKLILVLGHGGCGAVSAAVDSYLSPTDYSDIAFTHSLRSLVDRIQIAVRGAAKALARVTDGDAAGWSGYRAALLETAVYLNAAVTSFDLRREIDSLGGGPLRVVYGVYNMSSQRIHAMPLCDSTRRDSATLSFADAPDAADGFARLGDRIAQAVVEAGLLDRPQPR
jgi:carbonic anhydrase